MSLHDLAKSSASSDALRERIATGANVDEADKLRRTPVHIAAWAGNIEALQILVRANAAIDVKAMDGFTALHFAAQSSGDGAPACIRFLVRKNKSLLNMRITKGNKSALHLAAAKGNVENVRTLLELGADSVAKTTAGQTAADLAKSGEVKSVLSAGGHAKQSKKEETTISASGQSAPNAVGGVLHNDDVFTVESAIAVSDSPAPADSAEESHPVSSKKRPISEVSTE
jgi:ankyrin repeat protein